MSNVTSQSELTTKEIVEQAIQDYHESILPFLNGQVPTIANKFDKANLYSTDEQIVGRWKDGKPLYQKTIDINVSDMTTVASYLRTYDISSYGIEYSRKVNAQLFSNTDNKWSDESNSHTIFENAAYITQYNANVAVGREAISLSFGTTAQSRITKIRVTFQYTKTTDEAIAIGSDTDYSLEEKIVGTWVDDKPLYQKTISTTSPSSSSTANIETGATIEHGLIISGYINHGGFHTPINTQVDTDEYFKAWIRDNTISGVPNTIGVRCGSTLFNSPMVITFQYTKTTDVSVIS